MYTCVFSCLVVEEVKFYAFSFSVVKFYAFSFSGSEQDKTLLTVALKPMSLGVEAVFLLCDVVHSVAAF